MIPSSVIADELMLAAVINDWRLEVISTNWGGYWIIQLTSENNKPLAMLISFDQLTAICTGIRACIDAADNPSHYPGARTMFQSVAIDLPTQENNQGAISVLSSWEKSPHLVINYYRSRQAGGEVIRQGTSIEDAKELYNLFANIYNRFPAKKTWTPRVL